MNASNGQLERVVVIDYGAGNLGSVLNMGRKVGGNFVVSGDPQVIAGAAKLILPGIGSFDHGMKNLHQLGLIEVLNTKAREEKISVLGICLGAQLLTRGSEEGDMPGLGWINADTVRFRFPLDQVGLKVPHVGWNYIVPARPDPLLKDLPSPPRFYFAHSYHLRCESQTDVLAWTEYGERFASGVRKENIWGMQFHPEKSHKFGMQLLRNFITLN